MKLAPLVVLVSLLAMAAPAIGQTEVEFEYTGTRGPAFWGELSPAFASCSTGQRQSPIDLRRASPVRAERIIARYRPTRLTLENNGHTVEAFPERRQTLQIGSKSFQLAQFHFHTPSEHAVTGRRYPLELHFVHQAKDGERTVLGVLVVRGARNEALAALGRLPRREGREIDVEEKVDLRGLIPRQLTAYRYAGSLTTPPCSEGIRWNVATEHVALSRRQIARLRGLIAGSSARPLQERNGRRLIVG
jgi:carbonic anhydrase